jgi:predicted AAA+ superfamily ATPase
MRRKLTQTLVDWKNSTERQPILLFGARQVGKTYLAEHFGADNFSATLTVNFQTDLDRLTRLFETDLNPTRIIEELGYLYDTNITDQTLLIFDEIQLCQPAVTSLKYFAEQLPNQPIIATGSQFGVAVHRQRRYSFPVGKVTLLTLYPMDFEEFCWALGKQQWTEGIRKSYETSRPFVAHREAMDLYRRFTMVGGMPAAVKTYAENGNWQQVRSIQRDISALYTADMGLYLDDPTAALAQAVWRNAPQQLARDGNNKFKLSEVKSGARNHTLAAPFAYLESAGLIYRHHEVAAVQAPLVGRNDGSYYKVFLSDVGLLAAQLGVRPDAFLDESTYQLLSSAFRGALAENYVKQTLESNGIPSFYWTSGNTAEVDFLISDDRMNVVPIEVKSADNVRARSLKVFRDKYHPEVAVKISSRDFGFENGLRSIPLYAAFCLSSESLTAN